MWSLVMKPLLVSFAVLSLMSTAQAATGELYSCKAIATAAAEEWTNSQIRPSDTLENNDTAMVTVISYGRKYLVPRYLPHDANGKLPSLGELAGEYERVYSQELRRCYDIHDHGYSLD
jgi:hypothetical protein